MVPLAAPGSLSLKTLRGHSAGISSVAFSSDGKRIVTGSWDQTARVWDTASGQQLLRLIGHNGAVRSVAFSPVGQRLVTSGSDQPTRMWDATTGRELFKFIGHQGPVNSVAFSRDGKRIVTGSELLSWRSSVVVVLSHARSGSRLDGSDSDQRLLSRYKWPRALWNRPVER